MKKDVICVIILIAIAVSCLPFPTRINVEYTGGGQLAVEYVSPGNEGDVYNLGIDGSDTTISVRGFKLNYLFFKDKLRGKVTVSPYPHDEENKAEWNLLGEIFVFPDNECGLSASSATRYDSAKNSMAFAELIFDKSHSWLMLRDTVEHEEIYVAPANVDMSVLQDIRRLRHITWTKVTK